MSNRVLVVDGDVKSLRVLEVSLRGAGFDVGTAATGSEAWERLRASPLASDLPELVLSDTDLEGIDGFELCSRMRKNPGSATVPFLLLGADHSLEKKIRALEAGVDDYLVKPAFTKEVVARIRARLHRRQQDRLLSGGVEGDGSPDSAAPGAAAAAFSGDLAEITVVDLLQLVEAKRRSGIIHLWGEAGTPGAIYVRQGRVVDAEVGQLSGMDALSRLFAWAAGTFQVEWKSIRRQDAMERAPGAVIIEGLQKVDERNRLSATFSDPSVVFEVDYRLMAERLAEIPDEMNSVLRLCDGVRTLAQILEDCPLPDVEALTALIRLRAEGIVFDRRDRTPSEPAGGPAGLDPAAVDAVSRAAAGRIGPSAERAWSSNHEGEVSAAARRRTAHGLGHGDPGVLPVATTTAPPAPAAVSPETPRPDAEPRRDNLIQFPRSGAAFAGQDVGPGGANSAEDDIPPSLLTDALPPHLQALHRDGLRRHRVMGDEGLPERRTGTGSPSESSDSGIPRSAGGTSHTQRGFGARIPSPAAPSDAAVPLEVAEDRGSGGTREATAPAPAPSLESIPSLGARSTDHRAAVDDAGLTLANGGERGPRAMPVNVLASGGGDATERIRTDGDEITSAEARDELGLPSRWKVVRFLAVALVVGGLAALITHRLRALSHADTAAVAVAQVEAPNSAGQGDTPPHPAPLAETAPALVAAAGEPTPAPPPPPTSTPAVEVPAPVPGSAAPAVGEPDGRTAAMAVADAASNPEPVPGTASPASPVAPPGALVVVPTSARPSGELQGPAGQAPERPATEHQREPAQLLATCRTAFARNRQQEALSACTVAVAANPRSAEALTMLAHAELNRGRLTRAGELADKALALDPGIADAYVIAGGVHQDSGRNSEAKAAYRKYLELAPHGRYADELRSIVNSL